MPRIAIISTSLATKSRSRIAAKFLFDKVDAMEDVDAVWFDLLENPMPLYSNGEETESVEKGTKILEEADAWIIATPVHNWGAAASAVNFTTHCLDKESCSYKPFTLLAGASAPSSFFALDGFAKTIKTEVKGVEVGPPILCAGDSIDRETGAIEDKLKERLEERLKEVVRFARA